MTLNIIEEIKFIHFMLPDFFDELINDVCFVLDEENFEHTKGVIKSCNSKNGNTMTKKTKHFKITIKLGKKFTHNPQK
jgi:hypothetical protein